MTRLAAIIELVLVLVPLRQVLSGEASAPVTGGTVVVLERLAEPAPAELKLPSGAQLADELALQLSGQGLEVRLQALSPADGATDPVRAAAALARRLPAQAVVWYDLVAPASGCRAARMLRLQILAVTKEEPFQRRFCPAGLELADLTRAMALVVAGALRKQLQLPESVAGQQRLDKLLPADKPVEPPPPSDDSGAALVCPPCPEQPPPETRPECQSRRQAAGRLQVAAGFHFSSHPSFASAAYGVELELGGRVTRLLQAGLSLAAAPARSVTATEVRAAYQAWPVGLWARLQLGDGDWRWLLGGGVFLARVSLQALLQRLGEAITVTRWDPALRLRAGVRWWLTHGVALQALAGAALYLRTQRFTYLYLGLPVEVLSLERVSLDCQLALVVAFGW